MNIKQGITVTVLNVLSLEDRPTLEQALQTWWMNFRADGGMRLTNAGYTAFSQCEIDCYEFDVPPSVAVLPRHLLTLDKKLNCPYYIKIGKTPKLILFGSKQAMMLAMYGDIDKFLSYLKRT